MALQSPRIAFTYAAIKMLEKLVTDFPSVVVSAAVVAAINAIIDAENTAIGNLRTTAKSQIDVETAILKSQWPFADQTAFDAAVDASTGVYKGTVDTVIMDAATLKTDVEAEIPADIASYIVAIEAAIQAIAQALTPAQDAEVCGHCGGSGTYEANDELIDYKNETLFDTSTDDVICRTCLGNGITAGQFIKTGTVTAVGRP